MNIVYIICSLIGFCGLFIYFYLKNLELSNDIDELYDMYYKENSPEIKNKGKISVLNRKEVK